MSKSPNRVRRYTMGREQFRRVCAGMHGKLLKLGESVEVYWMPCRARAAYVVDSKTEGGRVGKILLCPRCFHTHFPGTVGRRILRAEAFEVLPH